MWSKAMQSKAMSSYVKQIYLCEAKENVVIFSFQSRVCDVSKFCCLKKIVFHKVIVVILKVYFMLYLDAVMIP
jgi:hypothetical protein